MLILNLGWTATDATGVQHTTIRLQLVAQFTGAIENTSTSVIFQNNIYRTTGITHSINLISTIGATYELQGGIQNILTGTLAGSLAESRTFFLTSGDGLKEISGIYLSEEWRNDFMQLPVRITYGLDTTPPPLTFSFSGPTEHILAYDPLIFTWDEVIDAGIGVAYYTIQLSRTALFSSAIEFSTTGTQLILGAGSIHAGQRYWRRGATDKLGNTIYSIPISFRIGGGSSQTIIGIGTDEEPLPGPDPTPIGDQCPTGDNSGNYFDGICTLVYEPPVLVNIPLEHQAADFLPRWEKIYTQLTEPKVTLYVFPNYEPPKPYTIYEYTPKYVYNDLYEYTENKTTTYPQLPYHPTFGRKKVTNLPQWSFTSKFSGIPTSRATSYLFYRFVQTTNSCSDIGQWCPEDPICRDSGSACYTHLICWEHQLTNRFIPRCPRKL